MAQSGQTIFWRQFEKGIMLRFGHGDYEDPNELLCRLLRQQGGFREFLGEFERLMNCLPEWPEEAFLIAFMAGLKEEIAGEIRLTATSVDSIDVRLANGEIKKCRENYEGVEMRLQFYHDDVCSSYCRSRCYFRTTINFTTAVRNYWNLEIVS